MTDEPTEQETIDRPEDAPEQEEGPQVRASCGVVFFRSPNGGPVVVQPLVPERDPVERRATPADIRGMMAEVEQRLQADVTVAAITHMQRTMQEAAINERIKAEVSKGNGKPKMTLPGWMRGRRG